LGDVRHGGFEALLGVVALELAGGFLKFLACVFLAMLKRWTELAKIVMR
jgi:hypothetical protein